MRRASRTFRASLTRPEKKKKSVSRVVADGAIAFASFSLSSSPEIFYAARARVNPGEFNTRLNVRERYADLRRQFITHFKADDAENAREEGGGGVGRGGLSKEGELAPPRRANRERSKADYRVRFCYLNPHAMFDR